MLVDFQNVKLVFKFVNIQLQYILFLTRWTSKYGFCYDQIPFINLQMFFLIYFNCCISKSEADWFEINLELTAHFGYKGY